MEKVYSRAWHMGKERKLRKHRESIRGVWRMNECRSEKARKDRYGGGKRFQEGGITREIYSKSIIQVGWWEVWGGILEKVGEELAKIKVSFSGGEILKVG